MDPKASRQRLSRALKPSSKPKFTGHSRYQWRDTKQTLLPFLRCVRKDELTLAHLPRIVQSCWNQEGSMDFDFSPKDHMKECPPAPFISNIQKESIFHHSATTSSDILTKIRGVVVTIEEVSTNSGRACRVFSLKIATFMQYSSLNFAIHMAVNLSDDENRPYYHEYYLGHHRLDPAHCSYEQRFIDSCNVRVGAFTCDILLHICRHAVTDGTVVIL